jgi:transcriptional regulator of arginine metabolism
MQKRKRQEAILALIHKHQIATQDDLVRHLHRAGISATQATVSRDIAELGLVRLSGADSHYVSPQDGLGAGAPSGREARLERLLRDLPLTVKRGQGLAVLITTPGSAHTLASAIDSTGWDEMVGSVAGDDTIFVALSPRGRAYEGFAQRLAALGAYVQPED